MKSIGGFYYVRADGEDYECKARGSFRKSGNSPVAGDRVNISVPNDGFCVIEEILPRKNKLRRPALANLDILLLGSINTAVLVTGIVTKGKKDIRQMGSGNAGFTNVLRSVGKVPAIITIVCDALKCIIAVLIGGFIFSFASVAFQGESPVFINELINCGKYVAGIFCILGHSYPVYFHFKGGKGVVTAAALMLTEDWRVFIAIIVTFLIIFLCSKIISLASVLCAILYAPYTFAMTFIFDFIIYKDYSLTYVIFSTAAALLIGVFVLVKHKENIKRLLKGEEKKITAKK